MRIGRLAGCLGVVVAAGIMPVESSGQTQVSRPLTRPAERPLPDGQRIEAKDGDVVLVEDDARVRIVRRRQAIVRAIHNPEQRWVLLLADYIPPGGTADGRVDMTFQFAQLVGDWPLPDRWDGVATLADYAVAGEMGAPGLGVTFPNGLVQFRPASNPTLFKDDSAVAVLSFSNSGRGGGALSFAEEERTHVRVAEENFERSRTLPAGAPRVNVESRLEISGGSVRGGQTGGVMTSAPTPEGGPVRVGGNIAVPRKVVDVRPIQPEQARQAGVGGVVILELTVGVDGIVTAAKVLRSIPLLDAAALTAAREWRYEPTLLNGTPVPVILTATVAFP